MLATRVGLRFPQSLSYDEWERAGYKVARIASSSAWFIGDWVAFGAVRYESRYRDAIDAVGLDYQTIRNYAWVARKFELTRRRENLSFQHHAEVASLPLQEQDHWLARAEECNWSRNQLRRHIRGERKAAQQAGQGESVQPLSVDRERLVLWTRAAELAGSSLEAWIIANLDRAADSVFTASGETAVRS
ncbi:LmbU family transcriptional regulator [Streptomyces sp. NPDC057623]|uniref:LmbU family transcriptional regulator n=1 Tax=Streptomyces sp. NPDC057623 TaxID=3346187 RepID=UPI00368E9334